VLDGAVPVRLRGSARLKKVNGVAVIPVRISLGLRRYGKVEKSKGTVGTMVKVGRLGAVGLEVEAESTVVVALLFSTSPGIRVTGIVTLYEGSSTPLTLIVTSKIRAG
jgi:hypothetical protein